MAESTIREDHRALLRWYRQNRRDLPWRRDRDPYRIWISEVMLQQTTVAAVVPYYERFLRTFPNVKALAKAPETAVLKEWAGLGYYSRARNLHKAAKALATSGFPRSARELIELPGFGPYTAAAVASIAFDDPAGVLDGNVIRVLCRRYGWKLDWWTTNGRRRLQERSDAFALTGSPSEINQALMELGATVCTPKSPVCLICPWSKNCVARANNEISTIPRSRPRKKMETWLWSPEVRVRRGEVALAPNDNGPVLKGQLIFPGSFKKVRAKPKDFDTRHTITHHEIFVKVATPGKPAKNLKWVRTSELSSVNPSRLLVKVLAAMAMTLGAGCSSGPKPVALPSSSSGAQGLLHRAIFSADGQRIFLLMSQLPEHSGAQIYEVDLQNNRERRVTWQDGEVESFDVTGSDMVVYASTTDESKERPHPSENPPELGQSTEVYFSDRFGESIDRLTRRPGYDGQVNVSPKGDQLVYISLQKGRTILQKLIKRGRSFASDVIANKAGLKRFSPAISGGGKAAWLEVATDDPTTVKIRIDGRAKPVFPDLKPEGLRRAPNPKGWIAWQTTANGSELHFLEVADCQKLVWSGKGRILWADVSPKPFRAALVIDDGRSPILSIHDLKDDAFTCEKPKDAPKIKS